MKMTDDKLLKQQHDLQLEAEEVVEELKLDDLLTTAGKPVRVGSSALGLMAWRDIDITVICSKLNVDDVAQIASNVIAHRGVQELRFLNDSGRFRADLHYPDGLYLGVRYTSLKGMDWNLDIWFVDEPEKQPDLKHVKTMPDRLTPELRKSILQIKSIWATHDEYGKKVKSYDIYKAVLDDRVRTPNQFDEWMEKMNHHSL
jgi:hypothetical protein